MCTKQCGLRGPSTLAAADGNNLQYQKMSIHNDIYIRMEVFKIQVTPPQTNDRRCHLHDGFVDVDVRTAAQHQP